MLLVSQVMLWIGIIALAVATFRLGRNYLPLPRILHPWPSTRFAVKHPTWQPGARIAPAGR